MKGAKTVKDVMVSISQYPHVPHWFSIKKAAHIAKLSLFNVKEYPVPMALLVMDEKYNLMGTLTLEGLSKGLGLTLSSEEARKMAERPASEIMTPAEFFIEPNDPIIKAYSVMIQNNLILLPVLEEKKFVGLVRMIELFDEVTNMILED